MANVREMGAGWCPPGIIGIGIGGNPEKAMLLAKESLMGHVDIHELQARGPQNALEELRLRLYTDINKIGIVSIIQLILFKNYFWQFYLLL